MSLVFSLRRAFDCGIPVGAAKVFISARGTLQVSETRDARFRRVVRTAEFNRVDGGEPIPVLRDVEILQWGSVFVLKGIEEIADDKLGRARLCAQTWQMVPEPLEELVRTEQLLARLVFHLHGLGVTTQMLPGGGMRIPGERRQDGEFLEPRPGR
jgi:hypothetical protein